MKMHWSGLDNNETLVVYVEHGDTGPMVDLLDTRGHGFAIFGPDVEVPFAVVDYRLVDTHGYTDDHMLAIEAHELGHIHENSIDERIAEVAAVKLLDAAGLEGAAGLLRARGIL